MTSRFLPLPLCLFILLPQRCLPNIITVGNIVRSNGIIYEHNIDTVNTGITVKECSDNDVAGVDCPELSKTNPDGSPSDIVTAVKTTKEPEDDDEDDDEEDDDLEPTTLETLSTTTSETVTVTGEQRHGLPTTSSSTEMPLTSSSSPSSSISSSSPAYSSSTTSGNVTELESTTEIQTTSTASFTTESTPTVSTLELTSTAELATTDSTNESTSTTLSSSDSTTESSTSTTQSPLDATTDTALTTVSTADSGSTTVSTSHSTTESLTSTMWSTSDSSTYAASTTASTSDSASTTVSTSGSTTDLTSTSLSTLDSTKESTSTTLPTSDSASTTLPTSDSTTESTSTTLSTLDSTTESTSTPSTSDYTTSESKSTTETPTTTLYETTTTESLSQRESKESTTSTESPTTSSTTNTPKPTAAPSTDGVTPDVCNGCVIKTGTGYVAHPTDCSRFVICTNLGWKRLATVMPCPTGLYWNQQILTCDHPNNVQCGQDICSTNGYKPIPGNCRGYWECFGGRAVSKCCPPLLKFDAAVGSCIPDVTCQDGCQGDAPRSDSTEKHSCRMRSVPEDRFSYEQKDTNGLWVRKKCPATTAFSLSNCACSFFIRAGNIKHDCRPELLLTFDNGTEDKSGKAVYVKNSGVRVHNGVAFFDGKSQISIDRFTNAWFGQTLVVRLVYQHSGAPSRQGILCNGNCNVNPSVYVGTTADCGTEFFVKTTESPGANFTVSQKQRDWQRVELLLHNGVLKGEVNGRSRGSYTRGAVETRQRALSIGKCGGTEGFTGIIDEVAVFTCKPKHPYFQADNPSWYFN